MHRDLTRSVRTSRLRTALTIALTALVALATLPAATANAEAYEIWFPVQTPVQFSDTWGNARSGGRTHEGTDIMAPQMTEVYAAVDGVIEKAKGEECAKGAYCPSYYLLLHGDDGRSYFYVHLNSDTPGRPNGCDDRGGAEAAFSPRLIQALRERGTISGVRVERGEHIAYVGSSGNAACSGPHLHFEMWYRHGWDSPKLNPYESLYYAYRDGRTWGPEGNPDDQHATVARSPEPVPHDRIAGSNRVLTSVALSGHAFDRADTVVIAPAENYEEALLSAPLGAVHGGPVLLTWGRSVPGRDALDDAVAAEIRRLGASSAIVVGSPDRLSPEVEAELVEKTDVAATSIRRVAAADRYELSARIAREVLDETEGTVAPLLALGEHEDADRSWPDALAGSVVAARQEVPVLLTRPGQLPAATRDVLESDRIGEVRIIGGTAAVSADVEAEVRRLGRTTRRLAGADRFATSIVVTEELLDGDATPREVFVASGGDFPDALASGTAIARLGFVLPLVHGDDPAQAVDVYEWLRDHAGTIQRVHAVGGQAAVDDDVLRKVATHANWPR